MVRGGGENRRKVAIAFALSFTIALMMTMPVSAGTKTAVFYDREGDMGKPWYSGGEGIHEPGDPYSWFSGNCPLANADYLDMLKGWVSAKGNVVTMGLKVAVPVPTDGVLPQGVTEVRWGWFFYPSLDIVTGPNYANICAVYVTWDGVGFDAVLVDPTTGLPFTLRDVDFMIEGNVLTVTTSLEYLHSVAGWFCDTIACHGPPWPLDQYATVNGWFAPDLTDYQGPLAIYWPWQPMP